MIPISKLSFRDIGIKTAAQIAVGVVMLVLAFIGAHSMFLGSVDNSQTYNWMMNYHSGYVHRGFLGSIFQMLHGEPTSEKIQSVVVEWDRNILFISLALTAALTLPRIVLSNLPARAQWFLLAAAAVLLTAPAWRSAALLNGYLDKWAFTAALVCLYAIIKNRPVLYAIPVCIGFLIHSQMIFYILLLVMLLIHAMYFHPAHWAKRRPWLAAGLAPLALSFVLYFLNDPQRSVDIMRQHGYFELLDPLIADFLNPKNNSIRIFALWDLFAREVFWSFLFLGGMPLAVAFVIALYLERDIGRYRVGAHNTLKTLVPAAARPLLAALEKYNLFIILMLSVIFALPIITVSIDLTRHLYYGWWGLAIAFIYVIHCPPPQSESARKKSPRIPPLGAASAGLFVLAYTFSGAPLVGTHGGTPFIHYCFKCADGWALNSWGTTLSEKIFALQRNSIYPIHAKGAHIWDLNHYWRDKGFTVEGDNLVVPADFEGFFLREFNFTPLPDHEMRLIVRYEAAQIPPIEALINFNHKMQLLGQDQTQAIWGVVTPPEQRSPLHIELTTAGGVAFSVTDFTVEMHPR